MSGRYEEAETFYLKAAAIFEKSLGSNHPFTVKAKANLEALLDAKN